MTSFSVIVPSFNPGQYLPVAVEGALSQLGPDDEVIVHDAGSTDGSVRYLEELAATDSRVRVFIEPDNGQSDAVNRALSKVAKEWVIWLNADDIIIAGALDAVRVVIETDSPDVVVGQYSLLNGKGDVTDTIPPWPFHRRTMLRIGSCPAFSGSIVIRTDLWRSIGGLDTDLHYCMDMDMQMKIARSDTRVTYLARPIGGFRIHEGSKTATKPGKFVAEGWRLLHTNAQNPGDYAAAVWGISKGAAAAYASVRHTKTYRGIRSRLRRRAGAANPAQ